MDMEDVRVEFVDVKRTLARIESKLEGKLDRVDERIDSLESSRSITKGVLLALSAIGTIIGVIWKAM